MRPASEVEAARALLADGLTVSEAARRLDVPRSTVSHWRHRDRRATPARGEIARLPQWAYCYLLGQYLGDGHLAQHRRAVWRLRVYCDLRHPRIATETAEAMCAVVPESQASVARSSRARMLLVGSYSKRWPLLLPQHGPGRKHERPIVLEPWQEALVAQDPRPFVRGLIHSDGTRSLNTIRHPVKTYTYVRYQFSNRSEDIKGLLTDALDALGIPWKRMNASTISIARREGVEALDAFVGAKA